MPATITGGSGPGGFLLTGTGTPLALWLDAGSINQANGSAVTSWSDLSGNSRNFGTPTGTGSIVLQTNQVNGLPTVKYTGTIGLTATNFISSFTAGELIAELKAEAIGQQRGGFHNFSTAGTNSHYVWDNNNIYENFGSTVRTQFLPNTASINNFSTYNVSAAAGAWSARLNNATSGADFNSTGTNTVSFNTATMTLGRGAATNAWNGSLSEVVLFNRALNTAERNILQNYLGAKYANVISNDLYAGDTNGNGDYDHNVFGIGSSGATPVLSAGQAGFGIETSALDSGDYVLAGHKLAIAAYTDSDAQGTGFTISGVPSGLARRWQRTWFVDTTDANSSVAATLAFDYSDAGLTMGTATTFKLLKSIDGGTTWTDEAVSATVNNIDTISFTLAAGALTDGALYTLGDAAGPVLNIANANTNYTVGGSAIAIDGALTVTTPADPTITGVTVTIGGFQTGHLDVLDFTPSGNVTGSYTAGILTLSGSDTAAAYQTVLQSVTFSKAGPFDGIASRTVTFVATDASSRTGTDSRTIIIANNNGQANISWDGGGDGVSWTEAANWVGDILPDIDDTAVFADVDPGQVTVSSAVIVGGIRFENTGSAYDIAAAGGSITLTAGTISQIGTTSNTISANVAITSPGTALTFDVAASTSLTAAGVLSGAGDLVKEGDGTLILGGLNTYSGATNINTGTLKLAGASATVSVPNFSFESGNTNWTFAGGGSTEPNGGPYGQSGAPDGTRFGRLQNASSISQSINFTVAGSYAISFRAAGRPTQNGPNPLQFKVDGVQVGSDFTPAASSTTWGTFNIPLTVATSGSHTIEFVGLGPSDRTSFVDNIQITFLGANIIPDTSAVTMATGTTFDLFGNTETIGSLAGDGIVTNTGAATTLTTGGNNSSTEFSGVIQSGSGGVALNKAGTGTMTLSGANTYTGATGIQNGTLRLADPLTAGTPRLPATAIVTLGSGTTGGTLDLNNLDQTVASLASSGSGTNRVVDSADDATFPTLTVNLTGTATYAGILGNTNANGFNIAKTGSGTWILSGANTFTGTTNVTGGILRLGNASALGSIAAGTTVTGTAALDLGGVQAVIDEPVSINGAGPGSGVGIITNSGAGMTNFGFRFITLTGNSTIGANGGRMDIPAGGSVDGGGFTLTKTGSQETWVASPLTNIGVITINQGLYGVQHAGALGDDTANTVVNNGTTLAFFGVNNGNFALTEPVTVNTGGTISNQNTGNFSVNLNGTVTIAGTTTVNIINTSGGITFASLTGSGTINKSTGTGRMTLSGDNLTAGFTGAINVNAGTLAITNSDALGDTAAVTTVASGATLEINGAIDLAEPLNINGAGLASVGAINKVNGAGQITSTITLQTSSTIGSGTVSNKLTIAGSIVYPTTSTLTFTGAGDIDVSQAFGNGSVPTNVNNALRVYSFNATASANLLINGNAGLIGGGDPTTVTSFAGSALFTDGPSIGSTKGLDYVTNEFGLLAGISQGNNFQTLWVGTVTVAAERAGNWTFINNNNDDIGAIWIDLDGDGIFESTTATLATNNGEQIRYEDATTATVNLAAGTYNIAILHQENSGDESMRVSFSAPGSGANPAISTRNIRPSDPAQAGVWSTGTFNTAINNPLVKNGTGTVTLLGNNTYNGTTTINAGTLVAASVGGTNGGLGVGSAAITVKSGGTLAFDGGVDVAGKNITINGTGAAGRPGAIANISGTNSYTGAITAEVASNGSVGIGSTADALTLTGTIDLRHSQVVFNGAGNVVVNSAISGLGVASTSSHLEERYFVGIASDTNLIDPASPSNYVNLTPTATSALVGNTNLSFSPNTLSTRGGLGLSNFTLGAAWVGNLTVGGANLAAGNVTFGTRSDDGSAVYIDLDNDGLLETSELVVDNRGSHAPQNRVGTRNLAAGTYKVYFGYWEGSAGGGGVIEVRFAAGTVTEANYGTMAIVNTGAAAQAGLWSYVISTNNALVKTGAGTVTLAGDNTYNGTTTVSAGTLVAAHNSALGAAVAGTTVAGTATLALQDINGPVTISGEAITLAPGVGAATRPGTLANISGNNTIDASSSVTAAASTLGQINIGSSAGLLSIEPNIDLKATSLAINGAGNVTVGGNILSTQTSIVDPQQRDIILGNPSASLPGLNPLAYWEFNEGTGGTSEDSSPNNNDGTSTGTAYVAGRSGLPGDFALNFTANSQRVTIPSAALGAFNSIATNNQITVSMWIYGDVAANPRQNETFRAGTASFSAANIHAPYDDSVIYWDSGEVACCGTTGRTTTTAQAASTFEGQWNHYVFVKNGVTDFSGIYRNGALVASQAASTANIGTIINMFIGTSVRGFMDDIAVFNTALNATTISDLWNARNGVGIISATNSLVKNDAGTAILAANNNTYSGTTTVAGGTLRVDGTLAGPGGAVTAASSGTLGGTGVINRNVAVNSGTLAPGASVGTLSVGGNVVFDAAGTYKAEVGAGANNADQTTITGDVTLDGTLDIDVLSTPDQPSYVLLSWTGTRTGTFATVLDLPSSYAVQYSATDVQLVQVIFPTIGTIATTPGLGIIAGGSMPFAFTVQNTGTGTLNASASAGGNTTGSASGISVPAASTSGPISGLSFTSSTVGLAQIGNFTVTDPAASNNPQIGSVTVDVFGHAVPAPLGQNLNLGNVHVGYTSPVASLDTAGVENDSTGIDGSVIVDLKGSAAPQNSVSLSALTGVAPGATGFFSASLAPGRSAGPISEIITYTFADDSTLNGSSANLGTLPVTVTGNIYTGVGVWNTDGNGNWNDFSKWTTAGGAPGLDAGFVDTDSATFGAALSSTPATISLNGVNPSINALTFDNAAFAYNIAQGTSGTLTFNNGASAATLTAAAGSHSISAPIALASNLGIAVTSASDTLTVSGAITESGVRSLTKTGAGTLILSGTNGYTGGTNVDAGTLRVNGDNSAATGAVTVASTATLTGDGIIGGIVSVASGGTLAPGNAIGTLTLVAAPSLSGTGDFEVTKGSGALGSADRVNVTAGSGIFTYGGTLKITGVGPGSFAVGDSWNLFDFAGMSQTGSFANNSVFGTAGDGDNLPILASGQWLFDYASGILSIDNVVAPTVLSVNPVIGPTTGGTLVTILGANFVGTTSVTFDGFNAATFTVVSGTQINAVTAAHVGVGAVEVVVTNAAGSDSLAGTNDFTFAPSVSSVVVNGGPGVVFGASTFSLAGQHSVVKQILVTFHEDVTVASDAFTVTRRTQNVTVNGGASPSTVAVVANSVTMISASEYLITFNGTGTHIGGVIDSGVYDLTTLASKVTFGAQTMAADQTTTFFAMFGNIEANNLYNGVVITQPIPQAGYSSGNGLTKAFVDPGSLFQFSDTFGSTATNAVGPPAYNIVFDYNLDGAIDPGDLFAFSDSFGIDWNF